LTSTNVGVSSYGNEDMQVVICTVIYSAALWGSRWRTCSMWQLHNQK